MHRGSVNSQYGKLRLKILTDVYVLGTFRSIFLDIIMLYRSRLSRVLTLVTISDKNISKIDCPFKKGNVYIKTFVNSNRNNIVQVKVYNNFSYNIKKSMVVLNIFQYFTAVSTCFCNGSMNSLWNEAV